MTADLSRERYRRLAELPPPGLYGVGGAPAFVGQVATAAGPGLFMTLTPLVLSGAETSGSSAGASTAGADVAALNLGPGTPTSGEYLLARWVPDRWVTERRGAGSSSGGHTIVGCGCTNIPDVIYMHVATPYTSPQTIYPAALTWQALPADIGTYSLPDPGYYSDRFTSSDGLSIYRYGFECASGTYVVYLIYTTDSPNGSYPGESLVITFDPVGSGSGNTCSPFSMHAGYEPSYTYSPQGITVDDSGPP